MSPNQFMCLLVQGASIGQDGGDLHYTSASPDQSLDFPGICYSSFFLPFLHFPCILIGTISTGYFLQFTATSCVQVGKKVSSKTFVEQLPMPKRLVGRSWQPNPPSSLFPTHFHTFTLSLLHLHFHTFTFKDLHIHNFKHSLSHSHFYFPMLSLLLSYFQFHTATFTLS